MNLPFLHFFKKDKASKDEVAVVPRPVTPLDKPASERFGKTVMPNVSRIVGVEATQSFESAPSATPVPADASPAPERRRDQYRRSSATAGDPLDRPSVFCHQHLGAPASSRALGILVGRDPTSSETLFDVMGRSDPHRYP